MLRIHPDDWPLLLERAYPHADAERAAETAEHLADQVQAYQLTTPLRLAHFLAQVGHESGELRWTVEIWGPSAAQRRYEGRRDLGNTQRGDGYRYRGRGLIQLTGRANYCAFSRDIDEDVEAHPHLVGTDPRLALLAALWYWRVAEVNQWADRDDLLGVTRRVNGGTNGLADRRRLLGLAVEALEWAEIRLLQRRLNEELGTALAIDGALGPRTRAALVRYQHGRAELVADGILGPRTWGALDADLIERASPTEAAELAVGLREPASEPQPEPTFGLASLPPGLDLLSADGPSAVVWGPGTLRLYDPRDGVDRTVLPLLAGQAAAVYVHQRAQPPADPAPGWQQYDASRGAAPLTHTLEEGAGHD